MSGWGGKRPGAGRPHIGDRQVKATLAAPQWDWLHAFAVEHELTVAAAVRHIIDDKILREACRRPNDCKGRNHKPVA